MVDLSHLTEAGFWDVAEDCDTATDRDAFERAHAISPSASAT